MVSVRVSVRVRVRVSLRVRARVGVRVRVSSPWAARAAAARGKAAPPRCRAGRSTCVESKVAQTSASKVAQASASLLSGGSSQRHTLGCPELRPATAISRLGRAGRPNPAFSTWPQHQACIAPPSPLSSPRPPAGRPPAGRPPAGRLTAGRPLAGRALAGRSPVAGRFSGTDCGSGAGCGIASSGVTIQSAAILSVRAQFGVLGG
eukprot:scaffold127011_cov45-Phaeocystis_antarctica.AAC.1